MKKYEMFEKQFKKENENINCFSQKNEAPRKWKDLYQRINIALALKSLSVYFMWHH